MRFYHNYNYSGLCLGLPRWLSGRESTCQCRRCQRHGFYPWIGKIHWSKKWQPTPVFLPGEFHGQKSLADCSPWGLKESDSTEHSRARTVCMVWDGGLQINHRRDDLCKTDHVKLMSHLGFRYAKMLIPLIPKVVRRDLVQILLSSAYVIKMLGRLLLYFMLMKETLTWRLKINFKKWNLAKFHYGLWICKLLLVITMMSDILCQLYINVSN